MVITRSDNTALEHILNVLLEQPTISSMDTTIPSFRACFNEAGVDCASDFISITPSTYGGVSFSSLKDGTDKDNNLNVVQIKKLSSLVSWFRQTTASSATKWFELTEDAFRSWRTQPEPSTAADPAAAVAPPTTDSSITDFRKGVKCSISDYKAFKEDRYFNSWQWHLQTTARSHNVDNVINLNYVPSTPEETSLLEKQNSFVYSVLEQTVLTPDGILIIHVHSDTGDAPAVYADLVDRYGKYTAAQLAASELESDLAGFRIDASWTKTNLAFLIEWTTKTLDLDSVLEQPITESQKRIWFTCAVSPKAILSIAIAQFDTSERLTTVGLGSGYKKAQFSILYDHVKDVAIRADQSERLLQGTPNRQVNETQLGTPPGSGTDIKPSPAADSNTFINAEGQRQNFVIPPAKYKAMTPEERLTALAKIRSDKGLPPKSPREPRRSPWRTEPPTTSPPPSTI
jgi:hypothetical protein